MDDTDDPSEPIDRRTVLRLLEGVGVSALAGCFSGGDGATATDSPTDTDSPTSTATASPTPPDTPSPTATDTPTRTPEEETPTDTPRPPSDDDTIDVLFLGGPEGGSHNAPARSIQVIEYLQNRGIEVVYTDRQDDLEAEVLHRYDAWMLYDNRSNLTQAQEDSLVSFVENGGGFVALHSASACFTGSDRFIDLLGGQFASHGSGVMTTEHRKPDHPVLTGVDPIESWDETYNHTDLNPDNEVLAVHAPDDQEPEPWTWVRKEGEGRVFYTAWGHDDRTWGTAGFKKLVENAIRWTSGNGDTISAEDTSTLPDLTFSEAPVPFYPADENDTVPEEVGSGQNWERMQEPLDPAGTARRTLTPTGFDLEYVVTEEDFPEELRGNILDFDFDHRGRCYVALSQDYPNAVAEGGDRIVICEDADGDGRVEEFTTFAEGLSIPNSILVAYGGVYVAETGHTENEGAMVFLEDTDGDDVADESTVLFSGFGNADTHAGPNELVVGIDNWIWGQVGYSGFSGEVGGTRRDFSSGIYRFRPDGSELEVLGSLPGNQAGLGFDEEGLAFASAATSGQPSNYLAIPGPHYDSIRSLSSSGYTATISDQNRFLPITDRVRQVDRHGGFTAAAGQTVYTARQYPRKYWNRATLVSDGTGHLLGAFFKRPDGAGFTAHNPHNMAASSDAWFSPTYSKVGPDGNVWFADLYEYIFQHNPTPDGFETGEGNAFETLLRDKQRTRLLRLTYGEGGGDFDLADAAPGDLVDALSHDNMFWRRAAQRLLVERGETDVVPDLIDVIENASPDDIGIAKGAVHALWTLEGLGALAEGGNAEAISAAMDALGHESGAVRMNAARVLPATAEVRDAILENDLLEDENMRVRTWGLLGLAETPASDAVGEAIYRMISRPANAGESILVDAASIAGASHAEGFVAAYEANEDTDGKETPRNLLTNPGFEDASGEGPAGWRTVSYSGSQDFVYDSSVSRTGGHSVRIDSQAGADASWSQNYEVQPNTQYRFSAYVKTGEDFEPTSGFGALINVHQLGQDPLPEPITEPGTDWTELSITFDSGSNEDLRFNCLFGGWGNATGTAWWDDASLVRVSGGGGGAATVYDRVTRHLQQSPGRETGSDRDGSDDVIDPSTTIELGGRAGGWEGRAPESIAGTTNPTLRLAAGETYTVTWENLDGLGHNFEILSSDDPDGEVVDGVSSEIMASEGETQTVEFTATTEMVRYQCSPHRTTMHGDVEVVE